ncbi:MAG: DUF4031 domain-containing protein [Moraxella sp.]
MIYIDNALISFNNQLWCHMMADSLDELHGFAAYLGIGSNWFHKDASYPHYDITVQTRENAICLGAVVVGRKQIIECGKKLKKELQSSQASKNKIEVQLKLF